LATFCGAATGPSAIVWFAIRIDFDAPHVSGCDARERPPAAIDYSALRRRLFAEIRMREAFGFAALQLEVGSGIAGALKPFVAFAGRRGNDLAEFRRGGVASEHGESTHGAGELVDLLLLVVTLGCQLARLDKQSVDLGVKECQRAFGREPLIGTDHAD
jgi:hypothetical protein